MIWNWKLEKKYLTRDNRIAVIIENDGSENAPFYANVDDNLMRWYTPSGQLFRLNTQTGDPLDLVSECIPDEAKEETS